MLLDSTYSKLTLTAQSYLICIYFQRGDVQTTYVNLLEFQRWPVCYKILAESSYVPENLERLCYVTCFIWQNYVPLENSCLNPSMFNRSFSPPVTDLREQIHGSNAAGVSRTSKRAMLVCRPSLHGHAILPASVYIFPQLITCQYMNTAEHRINKCKNNKIGAAPNKQRRTETQRVCWMHLSRINKNVKLAQDVRMRTWHLFRVRVKPQINVNIHRRTFMQMNNRCQQIGSFGFHLLSFFLILVKQ